MAMRIAPRTMLCGSAWLGVQEPISGHFEELRALCEVAGDKSSLAVGMYGLASEHMFFGRVREAARGAVLNRWRCWSPSAIRHDNRRGIPHARRQARKTGEMHDILRLAQTVIDWADGDALKGNIILGSPLAVALLWRGLARCQLGRHDGSQDIADAIAMARTADPATHVTVVALKYAGMAPGILRADDSAIRELEEALQIADGLSDDTALGAVKLSLGTTLAYRDDVADRQRGLEYLDQVRDMCRTGRFFKSELPTLDMLVAPPGRTVTRRCDTDAAGSRSHPSSGPVRRPRLLTLVSNLQRGTTAMRRQDVMDQLGQLPLSEDFAVRTIAVLRIRALLARARGDDAPYREFVIRYREMAKALGFERHLTMAEAM
jgi:hypothetical protein